MNEQGPKAPRIALVWAEARGGVIGKDGELPWHLPEDLAHFKRETGGGPVIMGRRTWESLPDRFRPLPGRENIVVTRNPAYVAAGATVVGNIADAASRVAELGAERAANIGGGELFHAAMPTADELVVTRIEADVEDADTFAPDIGDEWELVDPGTTETSVTGLEFRIERWRRRH